MCYGHIRRKSSNASCRYWIHFFCTSYLSLLPFQTIYSCETCDGTFSCEDILEGFVIQLSIIWWRVAKRLHHDMISLTPQEARSYQYFWTNRYGRFNEMLRCGHPGQTGHPGHFRNLTRDYMWLWEITILHPPGRSHGRWTQLSAELRVKDGK